MIPDRVVTISQNWKEDKRRPKKGPLDSIILTSTGSEEQWRQKVSYDGLAEEGQETGWKASMGDHFNSVFLEEKMKELAGKGSRRSELNQDFIFRFHTAPNWTPDPTPISRLCSLGVELLYEAYTIFYAKQFFIFL